MSNEERQRILREAGSRPAEAEKEQAANEGREALGREEGARRAEDAGDEPERPTPLSEDDPDRPRPRS